MSERLNQILRAPHLSEKSMARKEADDSASSQFYICVGDTKELDEGYTVFGKVVDGFDVVDAIGAVPTTGKAGRPQDRPLTDVRLIAARIQKD